MRSKPNSIERSLALTLSSLVLFAVAISFPFLAMKTGGFEQQSNLVTGVWLLYEQGMGEMATVVLLTCLVFPLLQIVGLLYILLPIYLKRRVPYAIQTFRTINNLLPWCRRKFSCSGFWSLWSNWPSWQKSFQVSPSGPLFC
jgi:paraquat-inducible protein A